MKNLSTFIVGAIAVIALIVASASGGVSAEQVKQLVSEASSQLGGSDSPIKPYRYMEIGGVRKFYHSAKPAQATYTLCSFQSPAATSTLQSAGIVLTTATSSAYTIYIAKAASATATTTLLDSAVSFAAGAQSTVIASTTPGNAASNAIIAPSQYINFAINPGNTGTAGLVPVGDCHAVFEVYVPR